MSVLFDMKSLEKVYCCLIVTLCELLVLIELGKKCLVLICNNSGSVSII